jgi:prepilin-type N-terminal cleavage/methylation domain-containing protein
MKNRNSGVDGGFTFIEILVVLTIVAILSVVAIPRIFGAKEKSRHAGCDHNYTSLTSEVVNEMDTRPGDPNAAQNSITVSVNRHEGAASSGGNRDPNPRNLSQSAYVDGGICGSIVATPSSTCQVLFCASSSNNVLVQQFEQGALRTFRIATQ